MKIAILGYSGAGKSTLAQKLGKLYHLPVLHLDCVEFEAGWVVRELESAKSMVADFMKNEHWVIDGNYKRYYQKQRLDDADVIIYLNFSRFTCFIQAYKRYKQYKGKTRESIAVGCSEKFDTTFMKWILLDGRNKRRKEHYKRVQCEYSSKIKVFRNRKQVEMYLKNLGSENRGKSTI